MTQHETLMDESLQPRPGQPMPDLQRPSPHWRTIQLGDVALQFISGGTPSTQRPELWDGAVPWTTSAPIDEQATTLGHAQRFITSGALAASATNVVPHGNLLVGTRVGVGKAVVNLVDIAISQDLTGVVLDTSRVFPEFIAFQFKMGGVKDYFDGRKRGTTIKGVSRFDLQELPLQLPPLPEQRAIAHVLRTVQDAIAARRRELELERERKAALMQHLFTYGTHGKPTKVTEIGEMPESWQIAQVADLVSMKYGYQTSIPSTPPQKGTLIISTAEIRNEGLLDLSRIRTVEIPATQVENYTVAENDILFNWRNAQEHVGKAAIVEFSPTTPLIFASFIIRLRTMPHVYFRYLHALLTYLRQEGVFFKLSRRAVNQANFNANELASLRVALAPLPEQHEIASILAAVDTKIAGLRKEIILHEELFRALLEELMTGRLAALPLAEDVESLEVVG